MSPDKAKLKLLLAHGRALKISSRFET